MKNSNAIRTLACITYIFILVPVVLISSSLGIISGLVSAAAEWMMDNGPRLDIQDRL